GIGRITLLVLTHFDLDHVGGTGAVSGRVERALVGPSSVAEDDELVQGIATAGAQVERVTRGRTGTLGQLHWRILWPPERLGAFGAGNDASVVIAFDGADGCSTGC